MARTDFPIAIANAQIPTTTPATLATVQDTNLVKYVLQFPTGATKSSDFCCMIPDNVLASAPTVRIQWRSSGTSGNCAWNIASAKLADTNSTTFTNASVTGVTAANGSSEWLTETAFALGNPTAATAAILSFSLYRVTASDTLAATAEIESIIVEYTTDPTITQEYVWVPAQALVIPSGSGATRAHATKLSTTNSNVDTFPANIVFRDANSDYVDLRLMIPPGAKFNGSCQMRLYMINLTTGNTVWRIDAAVAAVGGASDPALVVGTPFTQTGAGGAKVNITALQSLSVVPVAGSELLIRVTRLGSDGSDTEAASVNLVGAHVQYAAALRNPGRIAMDPCSGAEITSGAMVLTQVDDTNSSKFVAQAADGVDTSTDYIARISGQYASGGTLRVRWRTSAATGNGYFQCDTASPVATAASDPALTTGSPFTSASGGASVINEFTADLSTGLAASDNFYLRLRRLGSNVLDTLSASVDILDVILETNVTVP